MKPSRKLSLLYLLIYTSSSCNCSEVRNPSSECGGTFSGDRYAITSPNYPSDYDNNLNCIYHLIGDNKNSSRKCRREEFHVEFVDLKIERSDECSNDYLRIGNDSFYCGNDRFGIRKFVADNNKLKIIFHSDDNNVTGKGFRILISAIPCLDEALSDAKVDVSDVSKSLMEIGGGSDLRRGEDDDNTGVELSDDDDEDDDEGRGDRRSGNISSSKKTEKIIKRLPEGLKRPNERLELPIFEGQHFSGDKCPRDNQGSVVNPQIHSYLYLPPARTDSIDFQLPVAKNSTLEWLRPTNTYFDPFPRGMSSSNDYRGNGNIHNSNPAFDDHFRNGNQNTENRYPSINNFGNGRDDTPNFNPALNNFGNGRDDSANFNPSLNNFGNGNQNTENRYPSTNSFGNGRDDSANFNPSINNFGNVNRYPSLNFADTYGSSGVKLTVEKPNSKPLEADSNKRSNIGIFGIDETTYNIFGEGVDSYGDCCTGKSYNTGKIFLSSRNFPSLLKPFNNYKCNYKLERSALTICRLNINFKYFHFGTEDKFCSNGYVEIDGERYCGCKTGKIIMSKFDAISRKIITVNYVGYPLDKLGGFLLEINQEPCSVNNNNNNNNNNKRYDVNYEGKTNEDRYFAERNIFAGFDIEGLKNGKIREDVGSYINGGEKIIGDTNIIDLISCRIAKFYNWLKAAKEVYRNGGRCTSTSRTDESSEILPSTIGSFVPIFANDENSPIIGWLPSNINCRVINVVQGTISSLNYPTNYPNNSSECLRFVKAPGNCRLELAILDFDLEDSLFCRKDYVAFGGALAKRYCGKSLAGSRTIFDLTRSNYAEMYFVTDSYGNGRGFKIGFSQISC